jgi:hypothetical protein
VTIPLPDADEPTRDRIVAHLRQVAAQLRLGFGRRARHLLPRRESIKPAMRAMRAAGVLPADGDDEG